MQLCECVHQWISIDQKGGSGRGSAKDKRKRKWSNDRSSGFNIATKVFCTLFKLGNLGFLRNERRKSRFRNTPEIFVDTKRCKSRDKTEQSCGRQETPDAAGGRRKVMELFCISIRNRLGRRPLATVKRIGCQWWQVFRMCKSGGVPLVTYLIVPVRTLVFFVLSVVDLIRICYLII